MPRGRDTTTRQARGPRCAVVLLAALAVLGACDGERDYGDGLPSDASGGNQCAGLGDKRCDRAGSNAAATSSTTSSSAAPPAAAPAPAIAATAPPTSGTVRPRLVLPPLVVTITHDSPYFEPPYPGVYRGTRVQFTNNDTEPRSVDWSHDRLRIDDSGDIAPGASFEFVVPENAPFGDHAYTDGSRPYARGALRVLPKPGEG